ncbi:MULTISPECIES: hypothetical protein [unclassified Geodermatophilus]
MTSAGSAAWVRGVVAVGNSAVVATVAPAARAAKSIVVVMAFATRTA